MASPLRRMSVYLCQTLEAIGAKVFARLTHRLWPHLESLRVELRVGDRESGNDAVAGRVQNSIQVADLLD